MKRILIALLLFSVSLLFSQNNAQFISQTTIPPELEPGEQFTVSITMKNTGSTTWSETNSYRLGSQNPQDNNTWGTGRIVLPNDVDPGEQVTFTHTFTAPSVNGLYGFRWMMVQDGVEWFGDTTTNVNILVSNYNLVGTTIASGGNCYEITRQTGDVGAIWYDDKIDLNNPFDINFSLNIKNVQNNGSDGLMFVLQNESDTSLGYAGGSLGYAGIGTHSMGVEFDVYNNRESCGLGDWENNPPYTNGHGPEPADCSDHTAISRNGNVLCEIAPPISLFPDGRTIENDSTYQCRIKWDPQTDSIHVYIDCILRIATKYNIIDSIFNGENMVYWGFTASTGPFDADRIRVCLDGNIFTALEDKDICIGNSVQLDVQGATYGNPTWSPNYNIDDIHSSTPTVHPTVDTTYYLSYQHPECLDYRYDSVRVHVKNPTASLTGGGEICDDGSTSNLILDFTGDADWTYNWTLNGTPMPQGVTNNTHNVIPVSAGGTYTLTNVTDSMGCPANIINSSVSVTVNPLPVINLTPNDNSEICNGDSVLIDASASTGSGTLTFNWSTFSDSASTEVWPTADSSFYLTVTDENACKNYDTITIIVNQLPSFATPIIVDVTNCVTHNGEITVTGQGGHPGYLYNINGSTFSTVNHWDTLNSIVYTYGVIDSKGCEYYQDFAIGNSSGLAIDSVKFDEILCFGDTNSNIIIYAQGNNINYSIDNGLTTSSNNVFHNNGAGNYQIYIKDDSTNCEAGQALTIPQPPALTNNFIKYNVACYGDNSGSAVAVYGGGTPGYTLSGDFSNDSISNLYADTAYVLILTDANGCVLNDTVILSQPVELHIDSIYKTNILCYNDNNGSIALSVSGGVSTPTTPYEYSWSNSTINDSLITNLPAGVYYFTVTDNNNCFKTDSVELVNPDLLVLDILSTDSLTCFESNDGKVMFEVNGGTGSYTMYIDSNEVFETNINNLAAGNHLIEVIDENNCFVKDSFKIEQPNEIILKDSIFDNNIIVDVSGGTPNYNYLWNNGATTNYLYNLPAGYYTITVTDKNYCKKTYTYKIEEELIIPTVITPNADGFNDTWNIKGLLAYNDIQINIFNRWGDVVYKFNGSGIEYSDKTKQWNGTFNNKKLPLGSYVYIISIKDIDKKYKGAITIIR